MFLNFDQKNEIAFNFKREIPLKNFRLQFYMENPYEKSTFKLILKKSYQQGVFDFFYPDPQLVQNFKPTRNLSGQFFYIYKYIWV